MMEIIFIFPYLFIESVGLSWSYTGFIVLYLIVFSLQIGLLVNRNELNNQVRLVVSDKIKYSIMLFLLIYVAGIIDNAGASILNVNLNLFQIANENAVARYAAELKLSVLYKVSTLCGFSLAFLLGICIAVKNTTKYKIVLSIFFAFLTLDSMIMAARAGLLLQMALFISTYMITKYITLNESYFRISIKKVIEFFILIFFVFGFFILVQILRGGNEDYDIINITSHVLTWFIGYIPSFDVWVSQYYDFNIGFGKYTFAGIFDAIGMNDRLGGVYGSVMIGDGRESNIFTAFRGLIEDFTLPGTCIIIFGVGVLFSRLIYKIKNNYSVQSLCFLCILMYFFMWSFVINPYIYNSILLSVILSSYIIIKFSYIESE